MPVDINRSFDLASPKIKAQPKMSNDNVLRLK